MANKTAMAVKGAQAPAQPQAIPEGQMTLEAAASRQRRQEQIATLEAKKEEYVARLDTGAVKIEEGRAQGKDVSDWEDFWISLLRQYEAICDKLTDLRNEG